MTTRWDHRASLCMVATVACSRPEERQNRAVDTDVAAINAVQRQADEAVKSGNIEGYLAVVTDDAVLMPPDHRSLSGKGEIGPWGKAFSEQFAMESYTPVDHELVVTGDWAFRRSNYRAILRPRSGGDSVTDLGKFIIIYRRQPDGSWKIARDIFNRDGPPAGSRKRP
jgi:ketosteroid isomerase-like protein